MNKKNDWFAILMHQPDVSLDEVQELGITPDNTDLKPRDYYKNIPQVQEAFTVDGKFDENLFENFYSSSLSVYNTYSNSDFENKTINNFQYDPYDWTAPTNSKIKDVSPILELSSFNGISGITNLSEKSIIQLSPREIGQRNKIFNWDTQEFEDWSPNDQGGLFKSIIRPTLVLATWDEDGFHTVNGKQIEHKKGEHKFNEIGEYYFETIGNREIYNKDVLNYTDTLTVDGSFWNKYDFFDSDGLDKSVVGTAMKTLFTVGPMFIPYVGRVYGAISATNALSQLIPTLMKSINGIITNNNQNEFGKFWTNIENYTSRYNSSTSDYGRENIISIENLGRLLEDVSLQLFQQKVIGSIPSLLSNKNISQNIKLGRNLSLAYMAGTSSQEAYSAFKDAGANDRVAGLGMLGSIGAMYSLMTQDYFRELLFKGTYLDENVVKKPAWEVAKDLRSKITQFSTSMTEDQAKGLFYTIQQGFTKVIPKILRSSVTERAIGESVEEVMEEVSSDAVKALFLGVNALGIPVNRDKTRLNFDFSGTDMLQRYGMAFAGGFIGGPIFELHNKWEGFLKNKINGTVSKTDNTDLEEMVYLIRQGRSGELKEYFTNWHKRGKLGNVNLSGSKFEINKDGESDIINFLPYNGSEDNQNDVIYKALNGYIDYIENIIESEGMKISDEDLIKSNWNREDWKNLITANIIENSIPSRYFSDINTLGTEILRIHSELDKLIDKLNNSASTQEERKLQSEQITSNKEVQKLNKKLDLLRERREKLINGEEMDYYFGQSLFVLNPTLHKNYINLSKESFVLNKYQKDYNLFDDLDKKHIDEDYEEYIRKEGKNNIFRAYDIYLNLSEQNKDKLNNMNIVLQNLTSNKLYEAKTNLSSITEKQNLKRIHQQNLDSLKKKENKTLEEEQEITKLELELSKTNDEINTLSNNMFFLLMNKLTQEGESILQRPLFSVNENGDKYVSLDAISDYSQNLLKLYETSRDNNEVLLDDSELQLFNNLVLTSLNYENDLLDVRYNPENIISILQNKDVSLWLEQNLFHDLDNDIQFSFKNKVIEFTKAISDFNIQRASELKNELIEIIDNNLNEFPTGGEEDYNSEDKRNLRDVILTSIFPSFKMNYGNEEVNVDLVEFNKQIGNIRNSIQTTPFVDLLKEFNISIGTEQTNILDMLTSEINKFGRSNKIFDYVIENSNVELQLKNLESTTKILQSLLIGASDGTNEKINKERNRLGKDSLSELSENTKNILLQESNILLDKIQYLLFISEKNKEQKFRVQKDIMTNMRPKFINKLLNDNDFYNKFNSLFFPNDNELLREKWKSIIGDQNFDIINEQNYNNYENAVIEFENFLFECNFKHSDIESKLISLFGRPSLNLRLSTKMTTNPKEIVTDYDMMMYLAANLTSSSRNFYIDYQQTLSQVHSEKIDIAPIFSQEYSIRIALATYKNKNLFNNLLNYIQDTKLDGYNTFDKDYMLNKTKMKNAIFYLGGPGTGKSQVVSYFIYKMLGDDVSNVVIAPNKEQLNSATKRIDIPNKFTKSQFIEKINNSGKDLTLPKPKKYNEPYDTTSDVVHQVIKNSDGKDTETGHYKLNTNVRVNKTDDLFQKEKNRVLFIDEATMFTEYELELIDKWANLNNVFIFGNGDIKQTSVIVEDNNSSGLEDTFFHKTPMLTATLRTDNVAKTENYRALDFILTNIYNLYESNPALSPKELSDITLNTIKDGILLKYYESDNIFVGEKFISPEESLLNYVKKLQSLSKNIVLITDNMDKYQDLAKSITVVDSKKAVGIEYEYAIIDKSYSDVSEFNYYYEIKDLYTLAQRSRKGTIIVDNNNISNILFIKNINDANVSGETPFDQKQFQDFLEWRQKSFDKLQKTKAKEVIVEPNAYIEPQVDFTEEQFQETKESNSDIIEKNIQHSNINEDSIVDSFTDDKQNYEEVPDEEKTLSDNPPKVEIDDEVNNTKEKIAIFQSKQQTSSNQVQLKSVSKSENESNMDVVANRIINNNNIPIIGNDFADWLVDNMLDYEQKSDKSIYNLIGDQGNNYREIIDVISSYILYNNDASIFEVKNKINFQHRDISRRWREQVLMSKLEDKEYSLLIYPYQKTKGLLIAEILLEGSDINFELGTSTLVQEKLQIPISLITKNVQFGKLDMSANYPISFVQGVSYESSPTERITIRTIEHNKNFQIGRQWPLITLNKEQRDALGINPDNSLVKNYIGNYDIGVRTFASDNKGKSFIMISDNKATNSNILSALSADIDEMGFTNYLIKDRKNWTFVGVQQTGTPSEVIRKSISQFEMIKNSAIDQRGIRMNYVDTKSVINNNTLSKFLADLYLIDDFGFNNSFLFNIMTWLGVKELRTTKQRKTYRTSNHLILQFGKTQFALSFINNGEKLSLSKAEYGIPKTAPKNWTATNEFVNEVRNNEFFNEFNLEFDQINPQVIKNIIDFVISLQQIENISSKNFQIIPKIYLSEQNSYSDVHPDKMLFSIFTPNIGNKIEYDPIVNNLLSKETFKNELYLQDVKGDIIQNFISDTANKDFDLYTTDAVKFNKAVFSITGRIISDTSENLQELTNNEIIYNNKINDLKQFVVKNRLKVEIPNISINSDTDFEIEWNTILNNINSQLRKYITLSHSVISEENGKLKINFTSDLNNLINNVLKSWDIKFTNFNILYEQNPLNFAGFVVTLQNGQTQNMSIKQNVKTWELTKFESLPYLQDILLFVDNILASELNYKDINIIKNYIMSIQTNSNLNLVENYIKIIERGTDLLIQLDQKVNNYLENRIKNNEC